MMKAKEFKELIKESVREVIKEEIADILYEGLRSMQKQPNPVQEQYNRKAYTPSTGGTRKSEEAVGYSPMSGFKTNKPAKPSTSGGTLGSILQETAMNMTHDDFDDVSVSPSAVRQQFGGMSAAPSPTPQEGSFSNFNEDAFLSRVHGILDRVNGN